MKTQPTWERQREARRRQYMGQRYRRTERLWEDRRVPWLRRMGALALHVLRQCLL